MDFKLIIQKIMNQKNNIRMVVQSKDETAAEFAERLQLICQDLTEQHKEKIQNPPIVFLTSAGDGRQTATLQFMTTEKSNEPLFNSLNLHYVYNDFLKKLEQEQKEKSPQLDEFFTFLLEAKNNF